MPTFTTVFRAKINPYPQIPLSSLGFQIECAMFDLAGNRWAISYYPTVCSWPEGAIFRVTLLTETTISLKQTIQLRIIDSSGRTSEVAKRNWVYHEQNDALYMKFKPKIKLDSLRYVKDGCVLFEFVVSVTKWNSTELENKQQLFVPNPSFLEKYGPLLESGIGADLPYEVLQQWFPEIIEAHKA
ncbi:BTB/POZ and MATH domain-containing protein 2 [Rhynchospora pubera]|uniref:BTB/POZ and MATH domain-containing protein 2 n=1 Tax=Rhynchospora pubera TaxID=906938 RepID=A0AAV8H266_9POAL|nr:BTB/POZ and MATH domain-containing protein 2 [Rhynchospora pubera]